MKNVERMHKYEKLIHSSERREKAKNTLVQFVKFGIVGITNTFISYILNIMILRLLRNTDIPFDYVIANTVAFFLSVLWSFFWNNKLVFKTDEKRSIWKALVKTYLVYAFSGLVLSNVLSWIWITKFGISKYIAPLINLVITVPVNFVLNKRWTFKE